MLKQILKANFQTEPISVVATYEHSSSSKEPSELRLTQGVLLLLAELARELCTAKNFETLQQILAKRLRWLIDFDRCTLAIISSQLDSEYQLFELTSTSLAKDTPPRKIGMTEGWPGKVLQESKHYFIEDLTQISNKITFPPCPHWGIAPGARSLMLLPLKVGERTIGSLNFSSAKINRYSINWGSLASLLASQITGQLASLITQEELSSEHEFRQQVMDSATDAIYSLDLNGIFILANKRTAEITGYKIEELLGTHFLQIFAPDSTNKIQNLLIATIADGVAIGHCQAELITKDGSKKNITLSLAPLFKEGKISAVVGTAQDITWRKQAESTNRALERQVQERTRQLQQALDFEARLKRITDKVRDSLDESQIVQGAVKELAIGLNVGCCNMALYNLEEGTSTVCYEYATFIPASQGHIAQMANFPEIYRQLLNNQHFQFCSLLPNPERGRVAMLACPVADDQGVMGDLWLVNQKHHGFTELEIRLVQQVANQCAIAIRQARLYQASVAQVEELKKLNQLKDDFISTMSHELRTPITNIKMSLHLLQLAKSVEQRQRYLEILTTECEREAQLIDDLLDLQRLESKSYALAFEPINLQEWIPAIVKPFYYRTQARQQTLSVDLSPELPRLLSDRTSLGRILGEIFNNACKYTPSEGKIRLSVYAEAQSCSRGSTSTSSIVFKIANAVEIPKEELNHLFEKFYRAPNATASMQRGTGLGLALVQQLVEELQGNIQVASEDGWTVFTLRLPHCSF